MFKFLIRVNKIGLGLNIANALFLIISGNHSILIWPLIGIAGSYIAIESLKKIEMEIENANSKRS